MRRHMGYHYRTWNKICNMRMKRMKAWLRRALEGKKEKGRLKILAEASLANQSTWWWCSMTNLGKFWKFFVFLKFWNSQHRKFVQKRSTGFSGASIGEKVEIFVFWMMRTYALEIFVSFGADLVHQKVQKLPKMAFLPLFGHTEAVLGDSSCEG